MKADVKRVMSQVFGLPIESILDEATTETLDGWDSIAHLNLVMALEDEFGVRFGDDQILGLSSCEAIADAVARARADKGAT